MEFMKMQNQRQIKKRLDKTANFIFTKKHHIEHKQLHTLFIVMVTLKIMCRDIGEVIPFLMYSACYIQCILLSVL